MKVFCYAADDAPAGASHLTQLQAVFEQSFPPHQRGDFEQLLAAVRAGCQRLFVAWEDNVAIGLALLLPLPDEGVHYLEYLAVTGEARGRGVGAFLLQYAAQSLWVEANARALIFEVEAPAQAGGAERYLRERRIRFYERNGALLLEEGRYEMPDFTGLGSESLVLMWLPCGPLREKPAPPLLAACVTAIFQLSYGIAPDDPLLQPILSGLGGC